MASWRTDPPLWLVIVGMLFMAGAITTGYVAFWHGVVSLVIWIFG